MGNRNRHDVRHGCVVMNFTCNNTAAWYNKLHYPSPSASWKNNIASLWFTMYNCSCSIITCSCPHLHILFQAGQIHQWFHRVDIILILKLHDCSVGVQYIFFKYAISFCVLAILKTWYVGSWESTLMLSMVNILFMFFAYNIKWPFLLFLHADWICLLSV